MNRVARLGRVPVLFGLVLGFILFLAGSPTAFSQGGKALTADDIVERHVEAIGGAEAMAAIDSVVMRGIYEFNGEERSMTIVRKRPNRVLFKVDIDGESYIEAFDGETAWWQSPRGTEGPEPMDDVRAALFQEEWADFDGALVDASERDYGLRLDGQESIDGEACWKIEVTLPSDRKQTWFVAADDFLVKRRITPQVHPRRGEVSRTWFYEDYAAKAGVQFSMYFEREDRQFVRAYRIESIETDVEVPDSKFAMPETASADSGS